MKSATARTQAPTGVADAALPALDDALDTARVAPLLRAAWAREFGVPLAITDGEVTYVRYKPETSLIAGYRLTTESAASPVVLGYGKLVPGDQVREVFAKASAIASKRSESHVLLLEPLPLLFHLFPFDRGIHGLRHLMNRDKLKRIAREAIAWDSPALRVSGKRTTLSLRRYKPERRAVVTADFGLVDETTRSERRVPAHLKAYAGGTGERAARMAAHFAAAARTPDAPRIPRVLGYDPATEILFQEKIGGVEILDSREIEGDARRVGHALAWLHALECPRGEGSPSAARTSVGAGLAEMRATAGLLTRLGGESVARAAADLCTALERSAPHETATTMTHGDFHYHQVLVEGGAIGLVDFDEAGEGDPRADVGNFVAHLRLRAQGDPAVADRAARIETEFLRGYASASGGTAARSIDDLAWFVALGLSRLAAVPFRDLVPAWPRETSAILEGALRCIG